MFPGNHILISKFDLSHTRLHVFGVFIIFGLISCVYSPAFQFSSGQEPIWNRYEDPAKKFTFTYPSTWTVNTRHLDDSGFTEVTLPNSNSTRLKISIAYTPKDSLLESNSGKPVVLSRALTNLEEKLGEGYFYFNGTGKFPHKYSIKNHESAGDLVDYQKNEGQPGKMLIVLTRVNSEDTLLFTYSESKRSFFKNLSIASQILNSISV